MRLFKYSVRNDYDKKVRIKGENILCYSKKRLESAHPELYPDSLHQARAYAEREKKPSKKDGRSKYERQVVGEMKMGAQTIGVAAPKTNHPLLYKKVGYVCLEDNSCLALCVSRVPFLITVFTISAAAIAALILLLLLLNGDPRPVIRPDNPLPPLDEDIVPETGGEEQVESPEGGGSVSMIYSLGAKITLSTGDVQIHFRNPKRSNHSVAVQFYILSGGEEYLVAESGLIPSGNGLFKLTVAEDAPTLSEGKYSGLYRVSYYDPETGVRAHVQSDITDVDVTVIP